MFNGVIVQQALPAAVVESLGHHHLRVEQRLAADLTHQHPEMPIRAIQHRRHAEGVPAPKGWGHDGLLEMTGMERDGDHRMTFCNESQHHGFIAQLREPPQAAAGACHLYDGYFEAVHGQSSISCRGTRLGPQ